MLWVILLNLWAAILGVVVVVMVVRALVIMRFVCCTACSRVGAPTLMLWALTIC